MLEFIAGFFTGGILGIFMLSLILISKKGGDHNEIDSWKK